MSWKNKYPIVPDMKAKYSVGTILTIIGRTPLAGERCEVKKIWPNQKAVIYTVKRSNGKLTDVNERMLQH